MNDEGAKMKNCIKVFSGVLITVMAILLPFAMSACDKQGWDEKYDISLPSLLEEDGWAQTMNDEFARFSGIEEVYEKTAWRPSPHGQRKTEYWCDKMIDFDAAEGAVLIKSEMRENHNCDVCGASEGIFTGGIETATYDGGSRVETFAQAYGFFEAEVKVPTAAGMWSAFWLQSYSVGKIGNNGKDGTEIDVYESSFSRKNPTKTGNALHWDAYDAPYYKCADHVSDVGKNLYDGQYHKYSLLWTPQYYVFYVDRQPVWATDAGGVSTVKEYLRLTVEVRDGKIGPYGQSLGNFANADDGSTDFLIKSVNVWQNSEYEEKICADGSYADMKSVFDKAIAACVATGVLVAIAVVLLTVLLVKRLKHGKKAKKV